MIIALASPRIASSLGEGLEKVQKLMSEAAAQGAEIVCLPEAYLPGLRGQDFEVYPFGQAEQARALRAAAQWAKTYRVATILGMERLTPEGRQIAAFVIDAQGEVQGFQTKNQLDPAPSGECQAYLPHGQEGVLAQALDLEEATGLLAARYAPERYQEQ